MRAFPYVTKVTLKTPPHQLTYAGGMNATAPEQQTGSNEVADGKNVFTDALGGVYNRRGSVLLGSVVGAGGSLGDFTFRDNNGRQEVIKVVGDTIFHLSGNRYVPVAGAPKMSAKTQVNGCFFPDINKYVLVNGIDSNVVLDQSSGSLTATADSTMQKCSYVSYHDHSLIFMGIPGYPNQYVVSNPGTTASSAASAGSVQGGILGMDSFDLYSAIMVTDQKCYRFTGITQATDIVTGVSYYGPANFVEVGPARCVSPRSIKSVHGAVYWVGLDAFNTVEIYRCDGQTVYPVAGQKLKRILGKVSTSTVAYACACHYGPYYKLAFPYDGSQSNDTEILLDVIRSNFSMALLYQASEGTSVFEPLHYPGFSVSQYLTVRVSGQDFVAAASSTVGSTHIQGVTNADELADFSFLNGTPTTTYPLSPTQSVGQRFTQDSEASILSLGAYLPTLSADSTVTLSLFSDLSQSPSGTSVASVTFQVPSLGAPGAVSSALPAPVTIPAGTYRIVAQIALGATASVAGDLGTESSHPAETYANGVWSDSVGTAWFFATSANDIESYAVHTTCFGDAAQKKKTVQAVVNGLSQSGATISLGVGLEGRDSQFVEKPVSLSGKGSVWAGSDSDTAVNALHWADSPSDTDSGLLWASMSSDYQVTVFMPMYVRPSVYLSYRFYHKGKADWRVNSYVPVFDVVPSTLP